MSDIKISEMARKAAANVIDDSADWESGAQTIQLVINEACKPLLQALYIADDAMSTWFSSEYTDSKQARQVREIVEAHRKEHGQ